MSNPSPSPDTRFGACRGNPQGRAPTAWLRRLLNERDPDGRDQREIIARHLIEVASKWEVRVVGRDSDGELLKVASGRDSVEAAKLLMFYDVGKPAPSEKEWQLSLAEHLRTVARDHVEIGRQLIGKQAETWSPEQIRAFWALCERDPARFLRLAEEQVTERIPEVPAQAALPAPSIAAPAGAEVPPNAPQVEGAGGTVATLDGDGE